MQHETVLGWDRPAKAGDRLSIWVNDKGDYAGPPTRATRAVSDAIVVGALLWLSVITVVAAAIGLVRFRLDRRRHAEWDRGLRGRSATTAAAPAASTDAQLGCAAWQADFCRTPLR